MPGRICRWTSAFWAARCEEPADAAEHREDDEEADRQEGCELDERLGRDGDDQAFLVLGGIDVAGAEQDGKGRHQERDHQCRVGRRLNSCSGKRAEQRGDGQGDGFELQRDVGQRAGNRDDGDDGANGLALAVAGGEEVGDRGDVLALGEPHDAQQQAPAEREQQDGAEIDGNEVVAGRGGKADAAEECPGRAVDGQRERIDQRPAVATLARAEGPVSIPGQRKQAAHVAKRERDDAPAFDHRLHSPAAARENACHSTTCTINGAACAL